MCRDMARQGHDTSLARAAHGQDKAACALRHGHTPCDTAGGHDCSSPRHGHARAPGCACARLGVLAGPAGCALGAPSLFLDSVLFLSH